MRSSLVIRFKPLVLSIHFAAIAMGAGMATIAHAQVSVNIAAGDLNQALNQYALQHNVNLILDGQSLAAYQTTGLQGSYSIEDGFNQLLAQTPFQIQKVINGYTLVAKTAAAKTQVRDMGQLKPIDVSAQGQVKTNSNGVNQLPVITVSANRSTTENTHSYTTGNMNTATRLNLSMKETPQSTTVITRQRIDDQNMTSIGDVVRSAPGLILSSAEGPGRQSFSARGFNIDNIMYDGLPTRYQSWVVGVQSNMAMFDRVEIVRGATGLVTGSGNPSAAINVIRKRPTRETKINLTGSAGSWDNYRGEIDASTALNESGSVRGRIVGSYQDQGTFRDDEKAKHSLAYTAIETDLTSDATLLVGTYYQKDFNNSFWGGLPLSAIGTQLNLPRSTNPANDWEDKTTEVISVFTDLEYRFSDEWKLRLNAMKTWNDAIFSGTYLRRTDSTGFAYSAYQAGYDEDQTGLDLFVSGSYHLFGRDHEVGFGASHRDTKMTTHNYSGGGIYGSNLDPFNLGRINKPNFIYTQSSTNVIKQDGINAMTRLNLADSIKLILGGRLDWYYYKNRSGSGSYKVSDELTSYAGLIYDINPNHSVYGSFTTIFQPQSNKDINGKILDPITGNNYEVGIKGEYFDGALNASAALFRVDQENRAKILTDQSTCPTYPATSCYEAAGLVRSEGIDIEIQGEITPSWQIGAGYSYVKATYKKDADSTKVGQLFDTDYPKQVFKVTTSHQLSDQLHKWRIGGSLYWQDDTYVDVSNNGVATGLKLQQKAYTLLDVMLNYKASKNLDLQLNVNNVLDKTYYRGLSYDTGWGSSGAYGDPRNAVFTVRYNF
ncbi:TonB-dependent siderophore receptor [Acinetobacter puyangensis]|uniref:TonB-dependent siderophore receptor n=1 Tax=Acinetobacter puyangensis TaxID=1096779 RepID=UPI003A4E320A